MARRYLSSRRCREKLLGSELFADPAWDMLLDLFVASVERASVSVSSACIVSGCPTSTALAWIRKLERFELVTRRPDPRDGRRTFVEITGRAAEAVEQWLASVFAAEFAVLEELQKPSERTTYST